MAPLPGMPPPITKLGGINLKSSTAPGGNAAPPNTVVRNSIDRTASVARSMPRSGGAGLYNPAKTGFGAQRGSTSNPAPASRAPAPRPPAPRTRGAAAAPVSGVPANSPLLNPNATLSGSALQQAAQALANVQFNPLLNSINSQVGQNNRQTQGAENLTGQYFGQLGQLAQSGANQVNSIGTGLNSTLAGIASGTQSQLQGIGQNAQSSLLKYAPQGDGGLAAPAQSALQAEIARQQGLSAQDQGAFRSAGAVQGANYSSNAASNLGTFALAGQEALKNIAQAGQVRNEPLMAQLAKAQLQKSALTATDLGKLRQQEITNQFTAKGLGIKQQGVHTTAAYDAGKLAQGAAGLRIRANGQATTAAYDKARIALGAAQVAINQQKANAGGQLSANGANSITNGIKSVQGLLSVYKSEGMSPAQIQQLLNTGSLPGVVQKYKDPVTGQEKSRVITLHAPKIPGGGAGAIAQAAHDLATQGYLSRSTVGALNALGYRVGNRFRMAPTAVQGVANSAAGAATGAANSAAGALGSF